MQRVIALGFKPVAASVVATSGTGLYKNPALARSLFINETEENKNDEYVNITRATDGNENCDEDYDELTVSNLQEIASTCVDKNSLHHLLPSVFNFHEKEIIMKEATKRALHALKNPDFFAEILEVVQQIPLSSIPDSLLPKSSTISSSLTSFSRDDNDLDDIPSEKFRSNETFFLTTPCDQELLWENLITDHKCTICCDVLASPVILSCSHSFCGICLVRDMDFYESQDTEVALSCPYCREEIDSEPTFERTLDELISKKINLVRDCEAKVDWNARRTQYTQHLKILKDTREQGKEADDELSAYEKILAVVMPSVCIILLLIVVCARRSAFR